jgi:predicted lipid-binding transport protein (Tim44 family)
VKRFLVLALAAVAAGTMIAADFADARRLGGGRSLGMQRNMPQSTAPAPSTPSGAASNPVMPAQPGVNAARPAAPAASAAAAPAAARTGASRWLGPVAGLAAGLGLAALASHLGFGEELATFLMLALLIVGGLFVVRMLFARRTPQPTRPLQYAGGAGSVSPREAPSSRFEPVFGGSAAAAATAGRYPPGFEPMPFLRQAKQQFARLQEAYDKGDRSLLSDVMTAEMYREIAREIDTRGSHTPTEVVSLEAEILEVTTEGNEHWASVRFHGLLREDGAREAQPFDEVWNLVKPVDGSSGWLLAGIRQAQPAA